MEGFSSERYKNYTYFFFGSSLPCFGIEALSGYQVLPVVFFYSLILFTMHVPQAQRAEWTWRCNDSLLADPTCNQAVIDTIHNFLFDHQSDETSLPS